jgi:hypothetical protein
VKQVEINRPLPSAQIWSGLGSTPVTRLGRSLALRPFAFADRSPSEPSPDVKQCSVALERTLENVASTIDSRSPSSQNRRPWLFAHFCTTDALVPIIAENQLKDLIEHPTQHRASGVVVALHYGKQLPQNSQVGPTCGIYSLDGALRLRGGWYAPPARNLGTRDKMTRLLNPSAIRLAKQSNLSQVGEIGSQASLFTVDRVRPSSFSRRPWVVPARKLNGLIPRTHYGQ